MAKYLRSQRSRLETPAVYSTVPQNLQHIEDLKVRGAVPLVFLLREACSPVVIVILAVAYSAFLIGSSCTLLVTCVSSSWEGSD